MKKQILDAIQKNGRYSTEDLAAMLATDEQTIKKEIKEMEDANVICGYPTLINWDQTDCELVTALIEVKVTPQRDTGFDKTAERICNYPEVSAVYLISGDFDMMVLIEGKTLQEVSKFVSSKLSPIEDVTGTSTQFVLKKYKDHGTIMFGQKKPERMLITP